MYVYNYAYIRAVDIVSVYCVYYSTEGYELHIRLSLVRNSGVYTYIYNCLERLINMHVYIRPYIVAYAY